MRHNIRRSCCLALMFLVFFVWLLPSSVADGQDYNNIVSFELSPNGQYIALLNGHFTIVVVNTASNVIQNVIQLDDSDPANVLNSISWDHTSTYLVVATDDGDVIVWNAFTSENYTLRYGGGGLAGPVKWSLNDQIAVVVGATLVIYDGDSREQLSAFSESSLEDGILTDADWSGNAQRIAVGTVSNTMQIWNVSTETMTQKVHLPFSPYIVDWSPTSNDIATIGGQDATQAVVIDADTGKERFRLDAPSGATISSIAYSPDGTKLATGSENGITVWNAETGSKVSTISTQTSVTILAWTPNGDIISDGATNGLSLNGTPIDLITPTPTATSSPSATPTQPYTPLVMVKDVDA